LNTWLRVGTDMGEPSEDQRVIPTLPQADHQRDALRGGGGQQTQQFVVEAARLLNDLHFQDVQILDLRGLSDVTDYVLIASGTSNRQIRSVSSEVGKLAKSMGQDRFGLDQDEQSTWLVLDFVDAIVHLFDPVTRAHYDLEMMWGDAPLIRWQR